MSSTTWKLFTYFGIPLILPPVLYFAGIGVLVSSSSIQTRFTYQNIRPHIGFDFLNNPDAAGFLHNQVTAFSIKSPDGESLHLWHVLPIGVYRRNKKALLSESSGFTDNVTSSLSFRLLRDDPDARLVLYLHGASGSIASATRPDNYRAISAAAPDKIHVLAVDYRGYGLSSGSPSEKGLMTDAIATAKWAIEVAGVDPSKILVLGSSLGSGVAISLIDHFASQSPPVLFAGLVCGAGFIDADTMAKGFKVFGFPALSPLVRFPWLVERLISLLESHWPNRDRLVKFLSNAEKYHITFMHADDDPIVPAAHNDLLFGAAVAAATGDNAIVQDYDKEVQQRKVDFGEGGYSVDWETPKGLIRMRRLKYGDHSSFLKSEPTTEEIRKVFGYE